MVHQQERIQLQTLLYRRTLQFESLLYDYALTRRCLKTFYAPQSWRMACVGEPMRVYKYRFRQHNTTLLYADLSESLCSPLGHSNQEHSSSGPNTWFFGVARTVLLSSSIISYSLNCKRWAYSEAQKSKSTLH